MELIGPRQKKKNQIHGLLTISHARGRGHEV
jgi:hypothetical protein